MSSASHHLREPKLIVALDGMEWAQARSLVDSLRVVGIDFFKIGLEMFSRHGLSAVRELKSMGLFVFLDLKLHDIPQTVASAAAVAAEADTDLLTVHCQGGLEMLTAAANAVRGSATKVVGVTLLTSLGGQDVGLLEGAWGGDPGRSSRGDIVTSLAKMAAESGIGGIVSSVPDLKSTAVRDLSWKHAPIFVTPGIRDQEGERQDQKSVGTVEEAIAAGSTHLVVGRPITAPGGGCTPERAAARLLERLRHSWGIR